MNKHARFTSTTFRLAMLTLAMAAAGSGIAAEVTATSTGTVVAPIAITVGRNLSFGQFAPGSGGTVTLTMAGVRDVTGGVVALGGTSSAARFDVAGTGNASYSISIGASELTSNGNTMPFTYASALTESSATSGTVSEGQLTDGAQSIYVGGVLAVAANQAVGVYSGEITATVEYN